MGGKTGARGRKLDVLEPAKYIVLVLYITKAAKKVLFCIAVPMGLGGLKGRPLRKKRT